MPYLLLFAILFSSAFLRSQEIEKSAKEIQSPLESASVKNLGEDKSVELIKLLQSNEFQEATLLFNPNLKAKLTANMLQESWQSLEKSFGNYLGIGSGLEKITAEARYFMTQINFQNKSFDLQLSLDDAQQISSLTINPASNKNEWKVPSYAKLEQIISRDTTIGREMPLLAKWVQGIKQSKDYIVIMIHGSGPNDMDESIGPNKIFKDLAYGLASNGIASLRYNKRTYDYQATMSKQINEVTIDIEVTEDAVLAVKMAKELGYKKVILLGHSLGGHMAPKIAQQAEPDGIIIMAGNSSPMVDLLVPQYTYLMEHDSTSGIGAFQINALKVQVKKVKEGDYDINTNTMFLPLGMPGAYWLSLQDYFPQKIAKKQKQPYLILNGGRDYQVNTQEAYGWKNGSKSKLSKTIIYPSLNHFFYSGEGILLPSEYEQESHVEEQVIKDIGEWIKLL